MSSSTTSNEPTDSTSDKFDATMREADAKQMRAAMDAPPEPTCRAQLLENRHAARDATIHHEIAGHMRHLKYSTFLSTAFTVATFMTSWSGMNFQMPEYSFQYAYFYFIGSILTLLISSSVLCLFLYVREWRAREALKRKAEIVKK